MKTLELIFDGIEDFKKDLKSVANTKFYFVGGCVRDFFLDRVSKDIDIIVPHIDFNDLCVILSKYGSYELVGKSFPVVKFRPKGFNGEEPIDVSVPRIERSVGDKHTDFEIIFNKDVTLEEDLYRRDFTINAIAMSSDGEIIDLFGGLRDLKNKIIKMINEKSFIDDPLRILRAVQFTSRFRFDLAKETFDSMFNNRDLLKHISPERIRIEIEKGLKHESDRYELSNLLRMVLPIGKFMNNINSLHTKELSILTYVEFIDMLYNQECSDMQVNKIIEQFYLTAEERSFIKAINTLKTQTREVTPMDLFLLNRKVPKLIDSDYLLIVFPYLLSTLMCFRGGIYPKTSKDLPVDGEYFMTNGINGIEIGKMQLKIVEKIFNGAIENTKEDVENFIKLNKK